MHFNPAATHKPTLILSLNFGLFRPGPSSPCSAHALNNGWSVMSDRSPRQINVGSFLCDADRAGSEACNSLESSCSQSCCDTSSILWQTARPLLSLSCLLPLLPLAVAFQGNYAFTSFLHLSPSLHASPLVPLSCPPPRRSGKKGSADAFSELTFLCQCKNTA